MSEPQHARGLSERELDAIAALEREVVAADGGRLKLSWSHLRARSGERVDDVLWWDGDRLLGFVGLYDFASPIELAGMVAPDARRRGIAGALLDAALALCRDRGEQRALLIVPRGSAGGRALGLSRGATLDHSEHALALVGDPVGAQRTDGISLRPAGTDDGPLLAHLFEIGFGMPEHEAADVQRSSSGRTSVIEHDGEAVGTLSVSRHDDHASIYGFVIEPERQGRGLGREALRQLCTRLRQEGATRIGLEVEVRNERALTLYTSVGFEPVTTEDYYSLALS